MTDITSFEDETILEIKEVPDVGCYGDYEGYKVITDNYIINCLITSGQCCCEQFGYFSTPDDVNDFIGSKLLEVEIVNISNNKVQVDEEDKLNIKTSNGLLQLSVYQKHNGYYGHGIKVEVEKKMTDYTELMNKVAQTILDKISKMSVNIDPFADEKLQDDFASLGKISIMKLLTDMKTIKEKPAKSNIIY